MRIPKLANEVEKGFPESLNFQERKPNGSMRGKSEVAPNRPGKLDCREGGLGRTCVGPSGPQGPLCFRRRFFPLV